MGMGWPQRLDVRLDGKLLRRFTVGGDAPGIPGAASYAGAGEPGFVKDPEWEAFMQLTGDDHLFVQVPVEAGPHTVGVSFVRELWEEEGLPQPLQRGRVLTNDQIYMGYAAVGAVEIGGPLRGGRHRRRHPEPAGHLQLPPGRSGGRASVRPRDPVAAGPARVPPARHRDRRRGAARLLRPGSGGGGQLRARRAVRARAPAHRPRLPAAGAPRPHRPAGGAGRLPARRCRLGVAAVVLPLEQRPRRRAPRPRRAGRAVRPRGPRSAGPAHARRPARHRGAGGRLHRPVVEPAPGERGRRRPDHLSQLRRDAARGVPRRDRDVRGRHPARRPQRARAARRRLHVRQRAARPALRHPRHLRQPAAAGAAARLEPARRAPRARCPARHHVLSRPHLARAAREVAARQHLRAAGAAAPARGGHHPRGGARGAAAVDPRAARPAPAQPRVRELPRGDRSARVRAGELRRHRRLAHHRRGGRARRRDRHHRGRREHRGPRGPAGPAARRPREVPADGDREAAGLCAGASPGVLRPARGAPGPCGRRPPTVTAGRRSSSAS